MTTAADRRRAERDRLRAEREAERKAAYQAHIAKVVAKAPPLTPGQIAKLQALFDVPRAGK